MVKRLAICLVLAMFAFHVSAQSLLDEPTEKLRAQLKKSKPDSERVKLLLTLSKKSILKSGLRAKDIDSSYAYMKEAQKLSLILKDTKNQGNCLLIAALIANTGQDRNSGLKLSQQALSLFISIKNLPGEAESYIIIGQHYDNVTQKGRDQKIYYLKKAIAIFQRLNEKERTATTIVDLADLQHIQDQNNESIKNLQTALLIYKSIGYQRIQGLYSLLEDNYFFQGDVVNALKYGLLAVKTVESLKDTSLQLCTIYNRLGTNYYGLQDFKAASYYFNKAMLVARKYNDENSIDAVAHSLTQALCHLKQYSVAFTLLKSISGMKYYKETENQIYLTGDFLFVYLGMKDYKAAKFYAEKLRLLTTNSIDMPRTNMILSKYYVESQQYIRSYPYIKAYERYSADTKYWLGRSGAQLFWFKADSGLARYADAIKHYQLFKAFADSSFNEQKNKQSSLLQVQFETEKKTNDLQQQATNIELLKRQVQLRQIQFTQSRTSRNWIMAGSIMLLILLVLLYSRYRLKQRSNIQLETKQLEINHQNTILQKLVIEKDWLLKEVHHRVKNNLQIVMSLLSTQSAYLQNIDALEAIRESRNRVQSISLIHQKLYSGENVASIHVSAYVADLISYLSDAFDLHSRGIVFEQLIEPVEIDLAQAVPLGLILNEAITNAIKYAFTVKMGKVTVALRSLKEDFVLLTISDNGSGLPENFDVDSAGSLGMELMKALTLQLGGSFTIKNNLGTVVTVKFQLEKVLPVSSLSPLILS